MLAHDARPKPPRVKRHDATCPVTDPSATPRCAGRPRTRRGRIPAATSGKSQTARTPCALSMSAATSGAQAARGDANARQREQREVEPAGVARRPIAQHVHARFARGVRERLARRRRRSDASSARAPRRTAARRDPGRLRSEAHRERRVVAGVDRPRRRGRIGEEQQPMERHLRDGRSAGVFDA